MRLFNVELVLVLEDANLDECGNKVELLQLQLYAW